MSQRITVIIATREDHGLKLGNGQEIYVVYQACELPLRKLRGTSFNNATFYACISKFLLQRNGTGLL
jgi:hypothetical protein